jgi:membrane protein implicated in regulation of membrane protease activity
MLLSLVQELGPWSWWVLGLVLLAAELVVPGFFLVWIGLAAVIVGALSLALWNEPFWSWQVQMLLFAALAVLTVVLGRRYVYRINKESDEPFLNQRGASLVGRTATLHEPIAEGRGRIRLDDTYWSVMGPDLPAGTRVKVVASNGRDLTVEAV